MIDALALLVTVTCLGTALLTGVSVGAARYRWATAAPRLAVVGTLTGALAVLDVVGLLRGHEPRDLAAHLAYLGVALAVVPLVAVRVRGDDGRRAGALVVLSLVVLAVVVVRLLTTWRPGG